MSNTALLKTSKLFQLTSLSIALALVGCGGGNDIGSRDTVDSIAPGIGSVGNGGSTSDSTDGTTSNGDTNNDNIQELSITNSSLLDANNNDVTSVGIEGAYYKVQVIDKNKNPVVNAKVSFDIDSQGVVLSKTTSGAVLTDKDGYAQIFLKPSNAEVSGAYTITATANFDTHTASKAQDFSVQATSVILSELQLEQTNLPSGGQTPVKFKVTNTQGTPLSGILVQLNSSCGQIPSQMASDSDGMVQVVYKAINADNTLCSGKVRISASTSNVIKSANVTVAAPEATSIIYTNTPLNLGIQGSGSSTTGSVEFTVYSDGTPLANQEVELSLNRSPLGLSFGVLGNTENITRTTDENGKVNVDIYPGATPGPVEIQATLKKDTRIVALAKNITVASSRVTQKGLSISWGKNVLDWSYDGDSTSVTARLTDRNGNFVPDGTVVNFTAEGGKVDPSSCSTVSGVCSVNFTTQSSNALGDGRVSVLAVAEGEKDYIDTNNNNAWDEGVDILVHNIGNTFRDDNENGLYEDGEFIYPVKTGATESCDNNLDKYIQLKFPQLDSQKKQEFKDRYTHTYVSPNMPNTCSKGLDAVVRHQSVTLASKGSNARIVILGNQKDNKGQRLPRNPQGIEQADKSVLFRINSGGFFDLSPMPSGTTIAASVVDKTKSKPITDVKEKNGEFTITVSNANPSAPIVVKVGSVSYPVVTTPEGTAKVTGLTEQPDDISVDQEEANCTIEPIFGEAKVPDIVPVGQPGYNMGTINGYSLYDCRAGDLVKVSVTSPRGSNTTATYVIVDKLN